MKKQSVWIFVFCAVMLAFFLGAGVCGAAESASQYKSMYGTGYKNMYDPDDWDTPPSKLLLSTNNTPGSRLFRYYIPPAVSGTVTLALFVQQSQMIGAVARLGFPPQCDSYSTSTSVSESSFYGLPWDERDATLAQLRANDMRIRNYTGTISLVTDEAFSSKGEWLYVKVIFDGSTGSHINGTNFEVGIDSDEYAAWHGNTATRWDSNGDPLPLIPTGQTPTMGRCDDFNPTGGGEDPPPPPGGDDPFAPVWPPVNSGGDYTITVYNDGSGTVNPAGPVSVQSGASQTFTFTPVSGYVVDDVIIDSMGANPQHQGPVTSYTFTNVTDDHTISAIFKVEEEGDYLASNLWPLHTIAMQCEGHTVEFTPTLSFTDPPADEVEYYACYVTNGKLYFAQLGLDGQISFERYIIGDEVLSYGTFDFNGGDLWECTAFQNEDLMDNMLDGIVFYCGVCAVGDLDSIQGALFEFKCSP